MTPAEFPSFTTNSVDSTLTKRHIGGRHFLAVHDGNVRGTHALILLSCCEEKVLPTVL